ncbi:LCP family protein [Thalassobacillus devorans]|uniref:LCP family protein n=1 Tax=Thalassobacillus devorans TaxID=279813 RepID=UPI0004B8F6A0|nr:LCP family protein [Thalassobacillus devorans]
MTTRKEFKQRNRKKRRKRKAFIAVFLLFLIIGIGISSYEYMAGKRDAMGETEGELENNEFKHEFQGVDNKDGKTTVLMLGVDKRSNKETMRTDTIMIAQYDPEENEAKLASLMRDTYVDIPGYGYNKLNAAFAFGGPELLRQTIKKNFGIETEYYSIVDFDGFKQIVDTVAPEGIEVDVEKKMYHKDNTGTINLEPGTQKLNGEELLGYARYRGDASSDFGRVKRQQEVIQLMKDKLVSAKGLLKVPRLIGTIQPYVDTNIDSGKMVGLAKDFIFNAPDNIETLRIPVEGSYWNERYSHAGAVLAHDEQKNREALQKFFEVEDSSKE